ncbi:MAG TPA: ECF-type sigma factor [Pyrinomonadaceae bacterium]|nr:ECF-type sigma factor [Pyrinomonadaceae bacterium]
MNSDDSSVVTGLLVKWSDGDESALEQLIPFVERELKQIAHAHMRRENRNHTLQTTALVNEAYLKLIDQRSPWQNRAHFFGILLASEEAAQLISQSIQMEDSNERFVSRCVYAAANLLGGFVAGKLAILLTTFRPVRYPLVVATLVLGYFFYFLNHHWMPSPITFVLYTLPYFGAAAAGAAVALRPWSVLFDRERL